MRGKCAGRRHTIPPGTLELIARNRWIVAGHTLDLGLHFQLEKFSFSTEC
jgi:hypothetical protein